MVARVAAIEDIPQIQLVRNAGKKNTFSNPSLLSDADCVEFMTIRGKRTGCEVSERVVGFPTGDLQENNVWVLFVLPEFEMQSMGWKLHDILLDWNFQQTQHLFWRCYTIRGSNSSF